ncbi:MAG: protein translocase subunit SecF [Candidatus Margulisbacteria bacterium]|jgi:preprotein translocase subunit SecF|nr:protein translocase subunit SecF [Candidatus Margulisiibacteriota bacterium]
MDFIKLRNIWFAVAGVFIAASLAVLIFNFVSGRGILNFGIDFTGGTSWIVRFDQPVALADLRAALSGEKVSITTIDADFSIKTTEFSDAQKQNFTDILQSFGEYQILDFENIGPSAGRDLSRQAALLTVLVLTGMLMYITFRFEFWTGLAAVLCLLHDVIITLGFVSALRLNFDISMIAAILTIVGYSINATIIIFDRIRENLNSGKNADIAAVANISLRSVLGRCIMTSVTTILAVLAVYLFGGASIKPFALTMFIGFVFGAYSSTFLAAPLLVVFRKLTD